MGENKEIMRKYLKKYGMENLLHTLRELLEENPPIFLDYIETLKENLSRTLKEYQKRNDD